MKSFEESTVRRGFGASHRPHNNFIPTDGTLRIPRSLTSIDTNGIDSNLRGQLFWRSTVRAEMPIIWAGRRQPRAASLRPVDRAQNDFSLGSSVSSPSSPI
jgi:hypothetical protein